MAHRLPRPKTLNQANVESLPESPGAYVLIGSRGSVVYVGWSSSLRKRLMNHRAKGDVPAVAFSFIPTAGAREAQRLERELIDDHDPPFNLRVA